MAVSVDMPNVIDLVFLQELMDVLTDTDEPIFVAARDP